MTGKKKRKNRLRSGRRRQPVKIKSSNNIEHLMPLVPSDFPTSHDLFGNRIVRDGDSNPDTVEDLIFRDGHVDIKANNEISDHFNSYEDDDTTNESIYVNILPIPPEEGKTTANARNGFRALILPSTYDRSKLVGNNIPKKTQYFSSPNTRNGNTG